MLKWHKVEDRLPRRAMFDHVSDYVLAIFNCHKTDRNKIFVIQYNFSTNTWDGDYDLSMCPKYWSYFNVPNEMEKNHD